MVQVVENWAEVTGIVRAVGPSDKGPSYRTIIMDVDTVTDVPGFPNLLSDTQGTTLVIIVPGRAATRAELAAGTSLKARVRRASPSEVFASPDGLDAVPPPS